MDVKSGRAEVRPGNGVESGVVYNLFIMIELPSIHPSDLITNLRHNPYFELASYILSLSIPGVCSMPHANSSFFGIISAFFPAA
eukprot:scaffold2799_cov126-Skeletonema_marinoi.AAC.1